MDNAGKIVDVEATSRHVGGYERSGRAAAERGERTLALRLGPVAVDRDRLDTESLQLTGDAIRSPPGPAEHEGPPVLIDDACQKVKALLAGNLENAVSDLGRLLGTVDVVVDRRALV